MRLYVWAPYVFLWTLAGCGSNTVAIPQTRKLASAMAQAAVLSTQSAADKSQLATTGSFEAGTGLGTTLLITTTPNDIFAGTMPSAFVLHATLKNYQATSSCTDSGTLDLTVSDTNDTFATSLTENVLRTCVSDQRIQTTTEPIFSVLRNPTTGNGQYTSTLKGAARINSSGKSDIENFDVSVTLQNVSCQDTFANDASLASRTVSGLVTLVDNANQTTASLTLNNIARPAAKTCKCPTQGTMNLSINNSAAASESYTYTFGDTCGVVGVSQLAQRQTLSESWPFCTP